MGSVVPQTATATADGSGAATFTFPSPPQGTTWSGTVSIPQAPAAASAIVKLGGIVVGALQGSSPVGPYTAQSSTVLSLVASGLTAGSQYQAVWVVDTDAGYGHIPGPVSSVTTIVNEPGSTVQVSNTINEPLFVSVKGLPLKDSSLLQMTGAAQQLNNVACTVVALLAAQGNTGHIHVSDYGSVGTGSGQLDPGQGIVINVSANEDELAVLGTVVGDLLSVWAA